MTPFLPAFMHYCRLNRQGVNHHSVMFALEDMGEKNLSPVDLLTQLWLHLGRSGQPEVISDLTPDLLPLMVFHPEKGWGVAEVVDARGGLVVGHGQGQQVLWPMSELSHITAFYLPAAALTQANSTWALIGGALARHRKTLVHAGIVTALVNIISLVVSLYSMQIYDRVIPTSGTSTLVVLTVGAALALLFEFGLKLLRGHAIDQTSALVDTKVSRHLVSRLLGTRLDVRPAQVGTLAAQIKGFDYVRNLMASGTLFLAVDLPFGLLFLAVIAMLGGLTVLPSLVVAALSVVLGLHAAHRVQKLSEKSVIDSNRKNGVLVEAIESAETLKASRGEWRLLRRWNDLVEDVAITDLALRNHNATTNYTVTLLQGLGYVAMIATGAILAMQGELTTGALMACSILNGRAISPLLQLPSLLVQWSQAQASVKMLDRMLALPADAAPDSEQITPEYTYGELRVDQLRFGYANAPAPSLHLSNALHIRPSERVGILGEIGSGKSTLLKLLAGLYQPQGGTAQLDGVDLKHINPDYLRHALGYLAQDYCLVGGSLRDNLTLGLADPGDAALMEACQATGLGQLVKRHPKGLALPISEGGRGVSGGQRQLIGLTRLLLANAPVWLLDEPTASLDTNTEALVLKTLQQRCEGRTLIIVTHKQSLLPLFDRLIVVTQGRVVLDGPRDAVLARLQATKPDTPSALMKKVSG
jgi:ATP-binding cassette subfamily C protein LapB